MRRIYLNKLCITVFSLVLLAGAPRCVAQDQNTLSMHRFQHQLPQVYQHFPPEISINDTMFGLGGITLPNGMGSSTRRMLYTIKIDGTTTPLKELKVHKKRPAPFCVTWKHKNILYFTINTPEKTGELWRTDGTPDGTFLLTGGFRIFPQAAGELGVELQCTMNDNGEEAIFLGSNSVGSWFRLSAIGGVQSIWFTDGTVEGTVQVYSGTTERPKVFLIGSKDAYLVGEDLFVTFSTAKTYSPLPDDIKFLRSQGGDSALEDAAPAGSTLTKISNVGSLRPGKELYFFDSSANRMYLFTTGASEPIWVPFTPKPDHSTEVAMATVLEDGSIVLLDYGIISPNYKANFSATKIDPETKLPLLEVSPPTYMAAVVGYLKGDALLCSYTHASKTYSLMAMSLATLSTRTIVSSQEDICLPFTYAKQGELLSESLLSLRSPMKNGLLSQIITDGTSEGSLILPPSRSYSTPTLVSFGQRDYLAAETSDPQAKWERQSYQIWEYPANQSPLLALTIDFPTTVYYTREPSATVALANVGGSLLLRIGDRAPELMQDEQRHRGIWRLEANRTDDCPDDPYKIVPGICGCGTWDTYVNRPANWTPGYTRNVDDWVATCDPFEGTLMSLGTAGEFPLLTPKPPRVTRIGSRTYRVRLAPYRKAAWKINYSFLIGSASVGPSLSVSTALPQLVKRRSFVLKIPQNTPSNTLALTYEIQIRSPENERISSRTSGRTTVLVH